MFTGLDHLAIVVPDTEEALKLWRDQFGFQVVVSEAVNNGSTLLTHLDLGNTHLQLVQPLTEEHPLWDWLKANGPGLHHFCLKVDDAGEAFEGVKAMDLPPGQAKPHQGTQGKRAFFIDRKRTNNIAVEVTGP